MLTSKGYIERVTQSFIVHDPFIMHPPRGPNGRGVAPIGATRVALVFFPQLLCLLYAMGVYTYPKIHLAKLGSSHSTPIKLC